MLGDKIASDPYVTQMIEAVAKPASLISSLGMWDGTSQAQENLQGYLYCISKYPTDLSDLHFSNVDFSDYLALAIHQSGLTAPCVALARGAKVIESISPGQSMRSRS